MHALRGDLNLSNYRQILPEGLRALMQGETGFDLSQLGAVDSVAVSVLLHWQRRAQVDGRQLTLYGMPANLRSLLDLYGVTPLFSVV